MKAVIMTSALVLSAVEVLAMPLDYMTTTVDPNAQTIQFDLHFDGTPTLNPYADWFQVWLYDTPRTDAQLFLPADQLDHSLIGYLDSTALKSGVQSTMTVFQFTSTSNGFGDGTITDRVLLKQQGDLVSFTVPFATLGIWGTGPFGYAHATYEQGAENRSFYGGCTTDAPCATPEPSTLWSLLAGGAALLAWLVWRVS